MKLPERFVASVSELLPYFVAALLVIGYCDVVRAQQVEGPEYCMGLADEAIVIAAATKHGVPEVTLRAMLRDIYNPELVKHPVTDRLIEVAPGDRRSPKDFATEFGTVCMQNQGRLDKFFGLRM